MPLLFLMLCIISSSVLIFAYSAEAFYHLNPCFLCLWQRYIFFAIAGLSITAFILPRASPFFFWILFLLLLGNAGLAFYQVMIELHWIAPPAHCTSTTTATTIEELKQQLKKIVPCDRVEWRLFGLSMATYNGILCSFLALVILRFTPSCKKT